MGASINQSWGGGARPSQYKPANVVWNADAAGETDVDTAHQLLKAVVREQGNYYQQIAPLEDAMAPEDYHKQRQAFGSSQAGRKVDEAVRLAADRTAQAEADLARELAAKAAPGDFGAELRNTRAVQRVERTLQGVDAGNRPAVVRRLIGELDPATRGAVAQEIPSIAGVSKDFVNQAMIDADPELKAKSDAVEQLRKAEIVVRTDAKRVADCIAEGRLPSAGLTDPSAYDPDR